MDNKTDRTNDTTSPVTDAELSTLEVMEDGNHGDYADGGLYDEELSTIGIGILITSAKVLHTAGPGGAILAYLLTGTVAWSVIASLGEMTALMPVKAPIAEFASRYNFPPDSETRFSYVAAFAALITASSSLIHFNYDDAIQWKAGINYSPVIWIFIFLVYSILINLLPVRFYAEYEYVCGCLKITAIAALVLLMVIITNGTDRSPYIGTKLTAHGETLVYTGDKGRLLSMWSAMTLTIWSYLGMDIVSVTAAETKNYGDPESIKMATRKISLRILLLYFFCIVVISFAVPYDDPHLLKTNNGYKSGASSPFMIAVVNAGIPTLPHIINAFFIFSASSAGINSLYVTSRTLHAMAVEGRVMNGFITRRLKRTTYGVPMYAVFASAAFGLLPFMSTKTAPSQVLSGLIDNSSVSLMVVYWVICVTYLCFYFQYSILI
ncbi:hypothetical protein GP486_005439 [Trichoglossum hirsutum]|uniref:Amino acid permease/ SLC12A domain-containing protein n=1 Tax=Trichoglossum hirsutum TaxID=265104 RepID=A0A9P8L955_9PEZI|nr:hypothetical protein GP486_005439 [Trichoglossum hirsutum]